MSKIAIATLKAAFETGDKPNGADFTNLIDTLEDATLVADLATVVAAKVDTTTFETLMALKADATAVATKANTSDVFTKTEVNALVSPKADSSYVASAIAALPNATNTYTKAETDARIATVVGSAPAALDTLAEIAAQMTADEGALATLTTNVAAKLPLAGGTMSGPIDFAGNSINRYNDKFYNGGTTGGTVTLSLVNGTLQKFTLGGSHQFTMPAASDGASFTLILLAGASFTPTFSGVTNWIGTTSKATAPTFAVATGNVNVLTFFAESGSWYGFLSGTGV